MMNDLINEFKKLPFKQPIFWAVIGGFSFFALLLGVGIGSTPVEPVEPEIKEVEKIVEKKVEVCSKEDKYKELVDLDSQIISLSGQAILLMSDTMMAASEYDIDRINQNNVKMEAMQPQIQEMANKRLKLIEELK